MPRNLSAAFAAKLASGDVLDLSKLIRIDRTDGVTLGFTDADHAIDFGGLSYEAIDGVDSSAVQSAAGSGVDNVDLTGILSDRITEDDLARGVYDEARITVSLIERRLYAASKATPPTIAEEDAVQVLYVGYFGAVTITDGQYTTEVRAIGAKLRQTNGETTSRLCRCQRVMNGQCRLPKTGTSNGGFANRATRTARAASADGSTLEFAGDGAPSGHYSWGIVRFTAGANKGVERDVKVHTALGGNVAQVTLRGRFPFPVAAGDIAILEVGCDRTIETCRSKFGNANNFHGEPYLPGNDAIAQTGRQ